MKQYFVPFKELRSLTRGEKFAVLSLIPLYFIVIGLFLQPINEIIPGIIRIVREPDVLITDYFAVGGIGAALINAGLTTLLSIALLYFSGKEMDGHTITSSCLMFGFSLFGKNIVNIWAIMAGVVLYAKYHGTSLKRYLYVGLYGTSLSPIMTQMMHIGKFPAPVCLMLSLLLGLAIGFVLPPLCTHVHYAHQGYSLYNVGFGAGIILYFSGKEMDGHTITSSCLMFGFSLFGKNIVNIWAIMAGVVLYAKYHGTSLKRYLYVGLYGTSLSPIMTQMMHIGKFPAPVCLMLSLLLGLAIGFVLPPLCTHVHYAHQGYSLYNVGFGAGIIATVVVSLAKSFGIKVESRLIWSVGNNTLFAVLLMSLFGCMIASAVAVRGKTILESYRRILKTSGIGGTDYLKDEGGATTVFNMGVNGLFATLFVLAVKGDLNGPTICGIFTIVGFSSTGKHLRNIAPIMFGVYLASFTKTWAINQPSPILALLFSTTLAPVAGRFGPVAGIIAGYLHSSVALNVGIVYGGMNLYNNGFAGGIVAIFLVPVVQSISDRRARARGELSL